MQIETPTFHSHLLGCDVNPARLVDKDFTFHITQRDILDSLELQTDPYQKHGFLIWGRQCFCPISIAIKRRLNLPLGMVACSVGATYMAIHEWAQEDTTIYIRGSWHYVFDADDGVMPGLVQAFDTRRYTEWMEEREFSFPLEITRTFTYREAD